MVFFILRQIDMKRVDLDISSLTYRGSMASMCTRTDSRCRRGCAYGCQYFTRTHHATSVYQTSNIWIYTFHINLNIDLRGLSDPDTPPLTSRLNLTQILCS